MTLLAVWSADAGRIAELQSSLRTASRHELEQIESQQKSDAVPSLLISAQGLPGKKLEIYVGEQQAIPGTRTSPSVRSSVSLQPSMVGDKVSIAFSIETASQDGKHSLQTQSNATCTASLNDMVRVSVGDGHWLVVVRGVTGDEVSPALRQRQPAVPRSRGRQEAAPVPEPPQRSAPDRSRSRQGDRSSEGPGQTSEEAGDNDRLDDVGIRAYFADLVARNDRNGDKKLSAEEIADWNGYEDFQSVDSDADRLLGADELIRYFSGSAAANPRRNENDPQPDRSRNQNRPGVNESDR